MKEEQEMATGGTAPGVFGRALKRHREGLALSQEDLADGSGVAARTISDLERGVAQRPRSATVQLLAAGLGLSGADLEEFKAAARAWRLGGTSGSKAAGGSAKAGVAGAAVARASDVAAQLADPLLETAALVHLGFIEFQLGRPGDAIATLTRAVAALEETLDSYRTVGLSA